LNRGDIEELFRPFGRVDVKRMFGGHGIYADGVMFALEARGEIYLRVDGETLPAFLAHGLEPFVHDTPRGGVVMPYRKLAPEAHEDDEELAGLSRLALEAARRVRKTKDNGKEKGRSARRGRAPGAGPAARPGDAD